MVLDVPVGSIWSIGMQFYAGFEDLNGFLPIKLVMVNQILDAPLEILKSVLVVMPIATSFLTQVPVFRSIPEYHLHKKHPEKLQKNLKIPDQTPVVADFRI